MSRKASILITGASGEIGHGLIRQLSQGQSPVITLDLNPLHSDIGKYVRKEFVGSILDTQLLERINAEYEIDEVYHLAALLSTRSEFSPALAHKVNVEGTLNMLEFAQKEGESHGRLVKFFYPSSIAAYGMPDLATKEKAGLVREDDFLMPSTMYGANKLYCEHLGRYYGRHFKQLSADPLGKIDFRCVRFPGLISAETVPSGGTSDYAPEMLHAAAKGEEYFCFVRPDTRIPFMAMPDAVDSIIRLMKSPIEKLTRVVYNIGAFDPTAKEIEHIVREVFPGCKLSTKIDKKRQAIVDSWPGQVDDSAARKDWGHQPVYNLQTAFHDYLIPAIRKRYLGK